MPTLKFTGDARGAIKAVTDLAKAQKELASQGDVAEKKLTKMERAAQRIKEANDPQLRYNRQLKETALLANKGKLGLDDAQRAARRYGSRLEGVGKSGKNAFDIGRLAQFTGGLVSAASALAGIKRIFSELQQVELESAQRAVSSLSGFGELQQISKNEATFQRRKKLGESVLSRGITQDEGEAAGIAFKLDSAGLNAADKQLFLRLGENKFVKAQDLGTLASATTTAQVAIGRGETGSRRDLINKGLEAAANVDANASQLLVGLAKFGTNLGALKFSDEAGLAALELNTQARGTVGEGATLTTAALKAIENAKLSKGTFVGTIASIKKRRDAGENVKDILGAADQEAITGVRVLVNNLDSFKRFTRDIGNAQRTDPLGDRLEFLRNDSTLGPALQAQRAKGRLSVTQTQKLSPLENLTLAAKDDIQERRLQEDSSKGARFFAFLDRHFGALTDEGFLELTQNGNPASRVSDTELNQRIIDYLERTAAATEDMRDDLRRLPRAVATRPE